MFLGILLASIAGSLHCAAMCGGFATAAAGGLDGAAASQGRVWLRQASYASGRLVGYASLGAIAGLLGAQLQLAGATLVGIQNVAAIVTGILLILAGGLALFGHGWVANLRRQDAGECKDAPGNEGLVTLGGRRGPPRGPIARLRAAMVRAWMRGDAVGAALLGLSSALLPCGWLWAYVALAAAAGGPALGAATMSVFWLGTVPALAGVAWLTSGLGRQLSPHAPRIIAVLMIAMGAWSLAGRAMMPGPVDALGGEPCHTDVSAE